MLKKTFTQLAQQVKSDYGYRHGVYYFMGNLPAHLNHVLLLQRELGGTLVVLSSEFYQQCVDIGIPVVMLDDKPDLFLEFSPNEIPKTIDFLNKSARVVVYFEVFTISKAVTAPQLFLSHGNSLKDYFIDWRKEIIPHYTLLAGLGPMWRDQILHAGGKPEQIVNIGSVRSDRIIKNSGKVRNRSLLAYKTGLDPRKKIISYMPTWWGPSSVVDTGLSIVKYLSEEYNLIFRPHPQTPSELIDQYVHLIETQKLNARYLPEGNEYKVSILQMYEASSLFICDMSSVILDIVLTRKPLLFAFGGEGRRQDESAYDPIKEIYQANPPITVKNASNINHIVKHALENRMDDEAMNRSLARVHYGLDGHNTKDTFALIRALAEGLPFTKLS